MSDACIFNYKVNGEWYETGTIYNPPDGAPDDNDFLLDLFCYKQQVEKDCIAFFVRIKDFKGTMEDLNKIHYPYITKPGLSFLVINNDTLCNEFSTTIFKKNGGFVQ